MNIMRARILLALLFAGIASFCSAATQVQSGGASYYIDKAPAWVRNVTGPAKTLPSLSGTGSMQILLHDLQINLLGKEPVNYYRQKLVAQERAGLEQVSTIKVNFNPSYQRLTLHSLDVIRDGKRIDRLKSARIDLTQPERRLDEGVYDENVEAIIALSDVRVGDAVDFAYSLAGENPVFGGKYSSFIILNSLHPIARRTVQIQYPGSRQLHHKLYRSDIPVTETVKGGVKTITLDTEALQPVQLEYGTPTGFMPIPVLQVTEYDRWEEVGAWAANLYATPQNLSAEIESVLDRIRKEAKTPQDQAAKALAWVQSEIRYYSVAVGTSSHRPNHPNQTVRQRFGDCKDKSILLAAMLNKLGIKAEPALVSSAFGKVMGEFLPDPRLFDHVVVRVQLGGETYWLDGTLMYQGTSLDRLGHIEYGKALLASATSRELEEADLPLGSKKDMQTTESFRFAKYGGPAELTVELKYSGSFAEQMRRKIAVEGLKRIQEAEHADYGRDFPNIAMGGAATLNDDPAENTVTLTFPYTVPQLFSYEYGRAKISSIYARSLLPMLRFPGASNRRYPYALSYPATFSHRVMLDLPNKLNVNVPSPSNWQDSHLMVSNAYISNGSRISAAYDVKTFRNQVTAAEFPEFTSKFRQNGWPLMFSTLTLPMFDRAKLVSRLQNDIRQAGIWDVESDKANKLHRDFLSDFAIADEVIQNGLLEGKMLAKAYSDRATAASMLGRRNEALADIDRSIELEPTDDAYVLKGELQLYIGRFQDALKTFKLVKGESGKQKALKSVGIAQYYLKNYAEARKSLSQAAETANAYDFPFDLYWLSLATKKSGADPAEAVKKFRSRLGSDWPAEAVLFMLDRIDQEKLLAAARKDAKETTLRLCEAYFYLGQKALLDGKPEKARWWFDKVLETKAVMYVEHAFAKHELALLDGK